MKESTKDKAKGRLKQARGTVKEKAGKLAGKPDLESRGRAEKVAGKIQKKIGDIKKVFEP